MHRPLPVEPGSQRTTEEMSTVRWSAAPSTRYWVLVVALAATCVALAAGNTVLAIRLLAAPPAHPSAERAAAPLAPAPIAFTPPAEEAPASGPETAIASGTTPTTPLASPAGPAARRASPTPPSLPPRADERTSEQRIAAWMVASHGQRTAATRARAVASFYEGDAAGLAYWRAVLDEIERLPAP